MAAISRRGQDGRIYNNTRARVLQRRKCVKPADLTTHSPPKAVTRPRTATRPARALSLPHAARCIPRRPHNPFPAEGRHPPPHSDAPFPSTSDHPRNPDARPQAVRCTPADLTTHSPPKTSPRPRTATRPSRTLPLAHAAPTHARRLCDARPLPSQPIPRRRPSLAPAQRHALPEHFRSPTQRRRPPAGCSMYSSSTAQPIPRSDTLPPLPFRFGHKKTAPHSACAMPNVSVDRRCGRSFGLVSRALFAAVAGRWRVGVGLRPQPWALRSRRCGRVLRA